MKRTGLQQNGAPEFPAGRGSDRAFTRAFRHSRRVRMLRIALPVGLAAGLGIAIAIAVFNPMRLLNRLPVNFGPVTVSGTTVTMTAPRLKGVTRDNRGYEVTASAAAQDLTRPDMLELKDIRARLDMQDLSVMEMSAIGGLYDTKTEILQLGPDIVLNSTTGYQVRLVDATVDMKKGDIVSEKPVQVSMLKGRLSANRLEVTGSGDLLRFGGGVAMVLRLQPATVAVSTNAGATTADNTGAVGAR